MPHRLRYLSLAFIAGFTSVALAAGYWSYVRSAALTHRADNPRRYLIERYLPRGALYDRQDRLLAETVGEPGDYQRSYSYPQLAPVLGYRSPLYGSAGLESAADEVLHGDAGYAAWEYNWLEFIHQTPAGRAVRLSLDLNLQTQADNALGEHPGALVVLDAITGEILALASHPTYNPNTFEADWPNLIDAADAPLLNRVTANLYQPGGALQPLILAAALHNRVAEPDTAYPAALTPAQIKNHSLNCFTQPATLTLADAFRAACPGPFADLGQQLGSLGLNQLFTDTQLFTAPPLEIPTLAPAPAPLADPALAAQGQDNLNLTPLQLARLTAAIAREGYLPPTHLILAEQDTRGAWQTLAPAPAAQRIFDPQSAAQVKDLMRAGHTALALSGQKGQTLAWFSGFAPFTDTRYVVVVVLEDGQAEAAQALGQALLAAAVR